MAPPTRGYHTINENDTIPRTNLGHPDESLAAEFNRIVLKYAGYDLSKIKDIDNLDKEARKILNSKTTRKRLVFLSWPRDPDGQPITPTSSLPGKTTSNGIELWGATLYDFYYVQRLPTVKNLLTISTGSKLAAWMKANGELDWAAPEISWADAEESPKEVPPCDIAKLVEDIDVRLNMGIYGQSMTPASTPVERGVVETGKGKGKGKRKESRPSVFDMSAYPSPWPLVPFTYPAPTLQKYIPLHLLPKKLIVHDPWNVLTVSYPDSDWGTVTPSDWMKETDVTRVYHLCLSSEAKARLQADADKVAKERAEVQEKFGFNLTLVDGCIPSRPGETVCCVEPFISVVHPPVPQPEPAEEAHLYLSPSHMAGEGNHSVVYKAEWEIPRSMLIPPSMCQECIREDVIAIVKEQDGEDGSRMDPKWREKSMVLKRVQLEEAPIEGSDEAAADSFVLQPEGPVRPIATRIPWRSADEPYSTACSHTHIRSPYPSTTKVRVTAKLSFPGDNHLAIEAANYQQFPAYLFEHWNGYNVVPPLHEPTPVGAVVPQFYGFYKPEKHDGEYLSPIMLLEDCGIPVNPGELNIDDKKECASLYYRFHNAGWTHGSIAGRNMLVQQGPLSVWPAFRGGFGMRKGTRKELSFRLIDFGRSKVTEPGGAAREEMDVGHLLKHMCPYNSGLF